MGLTDESSDKANAITDEKGTHLRHRLACIRWYAGCEEGHLIWAGPDRRTEDEANKDKDKHDRAKHDGADTAVVLCY